MAKVSAAIETAFESAMFDDIEVVVTAAGLELHHFEPNERNPEGSDVVQFKITFRSDEDKTLDQTYRLGDNKFIIITNDGASFDFAPDAKGLSKKSEFYHFYTELKNAGFPVAELDEDKRGLKDGFVGGRYHIKAEVEKDSDGNVKRYTGKNNKEYDSTKIMVTKVITLPWEAKKGKATKAATKAAATAPAATKAAAKTEPDAEAPAGDVDVKEAVSNLVTEMVLKGPTKKQIVLAAALREFRTNAPARIDAMKLLNNTEFLKSIDGVDFDGTTLKLAE
jgi:hypothetical protein